MCVDPELSATIAARRTQVSLSDVQYETQFDLQECRCLYMITPLQDGDDLLQQVNQ